MRKVRISALLLVIVMLITGCGGTAAAESTTTTDAYTTTANTTASDEYTATADESAAALTGAALTPDEYKAAFTDFYKTYVSQSGNYAALMSDGKYGEAADSTDKCIKTLDDFAKITPPEKLSEKHNELVKSIDGEKAYLNAVKKFLSLAERKDSLSDSELTEFEKAKDETQTAADSSTFTTALLNLAKAVAGKE